MTVITVTCTNAEPVPVRWSTPPTNQQINSAIPLGLIIFSGTDAIAAKQAGDETSLILKQVMPDGFVYLLRNTELQIRSDDLVLEFDLVGEGIYNRQLPDTIQQPKFTITSSGKYSQLATKAVQMYTPDVLTPKLILRPADTLEYRIADMDSGATSAGDLFYYTEFYVFAIDQVDRWMVNAPAPVISHTSF